MTLPHPKEHAKKLVDEIFNELEELDFGYRAELEAKNCAIISINECIRLLDFINQSVETPLTKHYLEVKEEINKL